MADDGWSYLLVLTRKSVHIHPSPACDRTEKPALLPLFLLDNQTQRELFKLSVTHILSR